MSTIAPEGGFDIPAGINPVAQLNDLEEIFPKGYVDTIRSMGPRAGGSGGTITINIDAKKLESWLHTNAHTLAPALRKLARNAVPVTR